VQAKFVEAFELLAANPGSGTRRRGLTLDEIRWWSVFSFQVIYDSESQPPDIMRIIHGARDLPRLFPEEHLR
jgi:plasmid stabilization system protein ParE